MAAPTGSPHILVIPFPSQGHMLPLLDLCHLLSTHGEFTITVVTTPGNLPTLSPLLSRSPSISPLVLPFPSSPALPPGAENTRQLPPHLFRHLLYALSPLLPTILRWSLSHPNPPFVLISDFFTAGWTIPLARSLSIPRLSFSPSGAFALSVIHQLWRIMPPTSDPDLLVPFPHLPSSPRFPISHLSGLFRSYVPDDPVSEFLRENFISDARSWGFVLNSFSHLELEFIEHLRAGTPNGRVWAVGPLAACTAGPRAGVKEGEGAMAWLDGCPAGSVVYVCFGTQAVVSPVQAAALAAALEASGARFLWCVREGTVVPPGFEERIAGRGYVLRGWAPQLEVLDHASVGCFLTHGGWNSVLEAAAAGVAMLTWPRGADQFTNSMLVEKVGMAVRVAEGATVVPEVGKLAEALAAAVAKGGREMRERAAEVGEMAREAVAEGGSSFRDLDALVWELKSLFASSAASMRRRKVEGSSGENYLVPA